MLLCSDAAFRHSAVVGLFCVPWMCSIDLACFVADNHTSACMSIAVTMCALHARIDIVTKISCLVRRRYPSAPRSRRYSDCWLVCSIASQTPRKHLAINRLAINSQSIASQSIAAQSIASQSIASQTPRKHLAINRLAINSQSIASQSIAPPRNQSPRNQSPRKRLANTSQSIASQSIRNQSPRNQSPRPAINCLAINRLANASQTVVDSVASQTPRKHLAINRLAINS
jgi:hypothetical protein